MDRTFKSFLLVLLIFAGADLVAPRHVSAAGVYTAPPGWPKLLSVPRVRITAPVEAVPFSRPKDYLAPYHWGDVAWYDRGPRPGDTGRASVFGHLDSTCCPAAFYQLRNVRAGDVARVTYRNGQVLTFRVQWVGSFANNKLPAKFIWGATREHGLILMTCTGVFHRDGTGYDHKFIAYARLVLPNGKLG